MLLQLTEKSRVLESLAAFVRAATSRRCLSRRAQDMADEEKGAPETAAFDINDYTVIKEGEAEILMHVKNEVFYNKAQVCKDLVFFVWVLFWNWNPC